MDFQKNYMFSLNYTAINLMVQRQMRKEKCLWIQYQIQFQEKKEYAEENIPLLSIRKRTKAIQEDTQSIDTGERVLPIQYEESQSVRELMSYLKEELEPFVDERKKATPMQDKTNEEEFIID